MKKLFLTFICFIICLPIFSPTINANDIKVTVNEEQVYFDVSPQIINDRTMVPMRAIFESLGASVEWDAENSQIYAYTEGMLINLSPNKIYMTITNGEHLNIKYLDSPPLIVNDRTLVPVLLRLCLRSELAKMQNVQR